MLTVKWLAIVSLPVGIFSSYLNTEVSWAAGSPPDPTWQALTMHCKFSVASLLTRRENYSITHCAWIHHLDPHFHEHSRFRKTCCFLKVCTCFFIFQSEIVMSFCSKVSLSSILRKYKTLEAIFHVTEKIHVKICLSIRKEFVFKTFDHPNTANCHTLTTDNL